MRCSREGHWEEVTRGKQHVQEYVNPSGRADAPGGAGASRDGWSGVRTGSAIGREGEPITNVIIIAPCDEWSKCRSDLRPGPLVLIEEWT